MSLISAGSISLDSTFDPSILDPYHNLSNSLLYSVVVYLWQACCGWRRKRRSRRKDGCLCQVLSQGVFLAVGGGGREGAGGRMATCGRLLAREFSLLWEEEEEKEKEEGWLPVADC
jgi:hypothetical protein